MAADMKSNKTVEKPVEKSVPKSKNKKDLEKMDKDMEEIPAQDNLDLEDQTQPEEDKEPKKVLVEVTAPPKQAASKSTKKHHHSKKEAKKTVKKEKKKEHKKKKQVSEKKVHADFDQLDEEKPEEQNVQVNEKIEEKDEYVKLSQESAPVEQLGQSDKVENYVKDVCIPQVISQIESNANNMTEDMLQVASYACFQQAIDTLANKNTSSQVNLQDRMALIN